MNGAEFAAASGVSRETYDRLALYVDLLLHWNARINLISRSSEGEVWERHIADSAQIWSLRPDRPGHWVDLGSGAGFPGLVIAALALGEGYPIQMTLVESDGRKCAFLGEAARKMGLNVRVLNERIEGVPPLRADVLSARALAPLHRLLEYVVLHRQPDGMGLFPKGGTVHKEMEAAARQWRFEHRIHASATDPQAAIVEVGVVSSV